MLGILGIYSCKDTSITGSLNPNLPPSTTLTINEVNRTGADRLSSQIRIQWSGDDPDGFVIGFEYTFNNDTLPSDWSFTKRTDSVFVLPIPNGKDTADVRFRVRAIDNDSLRDPIGASAVFPIRNTPPTIQFVGTEIPSDTTYSVFNFGWQLNDIDGLSNVNRIEIQVNRSGNWVPISVDENFMVFNINDDQNATASAEVYFGLNYRKANLSIEGLIINGNNELMIRALDNAGAASEIDTVSWFIKRKTSRVLVLHDYATVNANQTKAKHLESLAQAGITSYDLIDISDGNILTGSKVALSAALPRVINPTLIKMIAKWDFLYFFSSDLNRNITYLEEMTSEFRENGGKIFVNVQMSKLPVTDPLFSFMPMRSFSALPDSVDNDGDGKFDAPSNATSFRLPSGRYAKSPKAGWDSLLITKTLSGIAPMEPASGAEILYQVKFQYQVPAFPRAKNVEFDGSEVICLKNAEKNIIYFSLDFNDVQIGSLTHLGPLVKSLCVDELGFKQD